MYPPTGGYGRFDKWNALPVWLRRAGYYILFTSDNGYMQGEHRVASGKILPYDPSTQLPLLIWVFTLAPA